MLDAKTLITTFCDLTWAFLRPHFAQARTAISYTKKLKDFEENMRKINSREILFGVQLTEYPQANDFLFIICVSDGVTPGQKCYGEGYG